MFEEQKSTIIDKKELAIRRPNQKIDKRLTNRAHEQ